MWQDYVFTSGAIILTAALIPTILDKKEKPALSTSLVSGVILVVFSSVYYSLSLRLSALMVGIHGILWFVLAVQKYHEKPIKRRKGVYSR